MAEIRGNVYSKAMHRNPFANTYANRADFCFLAVQRVAPNADASFRAAGFVAKLPQRIYHPAFKCMDVAADIFAMAGKV